jgi:hypothetical protein
MLKSYFTVITLATRLSLSLFAHAFAETATTDKNSGGNDNTGKKNNDSKPKDKDKDTTTTTDGHTKFTLAGPPHHDGLCSGARCVNRVKILTMTTATITIILLKS